MRALREQPRVTVAKTLGAVVLVVIGVAIGALVNGADDGRMRATEVRLVSAQRAARTQADQLRVVQGRAERAEAALGRTKRRVKSLVGANRRLQRDLTTARHPRRHSRKRS